MKKPIVVGIAGPSCSGKTTASEVLAKTIGAKVFHFDDYFCDEVPRAIVNGHESFERPELYDGARMAADIAKHISEHPHTSVVAEGFMLFRYPELYEICDARVFVHLDPKIIMERRQARALERGYEALAGRQAKFERSFLANGIEEWKRFGLKQCLLPGVFFLSGRASSKDIVWNICQLSPISAVIKEINEYSSCQQHEAANDAANDSEETALPLQFRA
jgi:dephospho-CoA kinase